MTDYKFLDYNGLDHFWDKIKTYVQNNVVTYNVVSNSANGLAPKTPTDTAQHTLLYLRADGTWAIPPTTSYSAMTQQEYNTGTDILGKLISPQLLHNIIASIPMQNSFLVEQVTKAYTITANGSTSDTISVSKTGYTPIALAGFNVGNAEVAVLRCDLWSDQTVHFTVKNLTSSAVSTTFYVKVTYVANS